MKKHLMILASLSLWLVGSAVADVIRHPLPNNSTFPIASAVEVPAGTTITFHSGTVPGAADRTAERGTPAFYGDTRTQTISVFERIKKNLESQGMDMGNIIKLTVFLVGDPAKGNAMDFAGFMEAYVQYFGTKEQPNLPARSAVQIAGLVGPLMFDEIEAITAR